MNWILSFTPQDGMKMGGIILMVAAALFLLVVALVFAIKLPELPTSNNFDMEKLGNSRNYRLYLEHCEKRDEDGEKARAWKIKADNKLTSAYVDHVLDELRKVYAQVDKM